MKLLVFLLVVYCYFVPIQAQNHFTFPSKNDSLVRHFYYTLSFDTLLQQATWVSYTLLPYDGEKEERAKSFKVDPLLTKWTNHAKEYAKSGFDRGHLAPAGDFTFSDTAMMETFYYSNMSPQLPEFNRGIWKKIESEIRLLSLESDSIWVTTGPLWISDSIKTMGKIPIPTHFYKAICRFKSDQVSTFGYLLPHEGSTESTTFFQLSIDLLEEFTHLDFFNSLPVSLQITTESNPTTFFPFPVEIKEEKSIIDTKGIQEPKESVPCTGTTKKGNRCLNKTKNASGLCHLHEK